MTDTPPAKIEPWKEPKEERDKFEAWYVCHIGDLSQYPSRECYLQWDAWKAAIIAAHAPEPEWEAKEKALRELCFNLRAGCAYQTDKDYRIAFKIEAILNTPAAGGRGEREN